MLLDILKNSKQVTACTTQPICVYSKTRYSYSECLDRRTNDNLELDSIDDSYGLVIEKFGDRIDAYVPKDAKCILRKAGNPNYDCILVYKNIECDLAFDDSIDDSIDNYFDIMEK